MTTRLRTAAVLGAAALLLAAPASVASAATGSTPPVPGCPAAAEVLYAAALQVFGPIGCVAHLGCFLFSDDSLTPRH